MKTEAAKLLLDVAKPLLGGVLITGIMRRDISPSLLFLVGGAATVLLISSAFALIWWNNKKQIKINAMELIYFIGAMGVCALGVLVYACIGIYKMKRSSAL
jgi:uncharacterized membrane protein